MSSKRLIERILCFCVFFYQLWNLWFSLDSSYVCQFPQQDQLQNACSFIILWFSEEKVANLGATLFVLTAPKQCYWCKYNFVFYLPPCFWIICYWPNLLLFRFFIIFLFIKSPLSIHENKTCKPLTVRVDREKNDSWSACFQPTICGEGDCPE